MNNKTGLAGIATAIACLILASGTAPAQQPPAQASSLITAGDLVFVEVHRQPELSTSSQVGSDGTLLMPHIGPVRVAGMNEQAASAAVSDALKSIMHNPRVSVRRTGSGGFTGGFRTADMDTELIPLHNSDAETLSVSLANMTSEGGAISFDRDTNTLIITDTPAAIQNITSAVTQLDKMQNQLTQVLIEAKIAEVKIGAVKELGIRWFFHNDEITGGYYPHAPQDPATGAIHGRTAAPQNNESIGMNNVNQQSIGRRFIDNTLDRRLDVPVQLPKAGQMFFGFLNSGIDLGVMLDALVADNAAKVLAAPTILTANHKEAEIRSTEEYPFTQYGVDFGRDTFSTRFLDLGIILRVKPHVGQDSTGRLVKLELEPEVSYPSGTANGIPIRAVRSSRTTQFVRDGQALVVGGIYRNDNRTVDSGVPGLRRIPGLGKLFQHQEKVQTQTELMVFVTPTVHETPESVTWQRMLNVSTLGAPELAAPGSGQQPAGNPD
jgi:type II secretory pathway component GspD/PulD (secretin)